MFAGKNTVWVSADRRCKLNFDTGLRSLNFYVDDVIVATWGATTMGFFGSANTARPTAAVAVASTAPTNSGAWGATTSTQFAAMLTAINTLISNLSTVGLQA